MLKNHLLHNFDILLRLININNIKLRQLENKNNEYGQLFIDAIDINKYIKIICYINGDNYTYQCYELIYEDIDSDIPLTEVLLKEDESIFKIFIFSINRIIENIVTDYSVISQIKDEEENA